MAEMLRFFELQSFAANWSVCSFVLISKVAVDDLGVTLHKS